MNELFVRLPSVGELYYHHTYLFYDEPLIFSCATKAMQYYFVLAISAAPSSDETWIMVPISSGKLNKAEKNVIELRELIVNPETVVFRVDRIGTEISAITIDPSSLTDEMLPEAGEYLDYRPALELLPSAQAPVEQAVVEMRDVIEISLEKDDGHAHELPCLTVVDAIDNIQQLVYALAYKNGGIRGAIPQRIKEDCQLSITGMFAASVGIRLKSDELCDMYFETPLTATLNDLNHLFDVAADKDSLKAFLSEQNPRVAYRFRALLAALIHGKVGIKLNTASPNKNSYTKHYSTKELAKSFALIEAEIEEIVETQSFYGELVGVNVERNTFEFVTTDNEHIRGKIAASICDSVFSIPQTAEAVVEMRIGQDTMTRAEKILYTLVDIKAIVPGQG